MPIKNNIFFSMVICSGGWLDEAADLVWVIHKSGKAVIPLAWPACWHEAQSSHLKFG
jgi:hypothetical protein